MKIQYSIIVFMLMAFWAEAQETYSYITDRRFSDPSELIGYNFKPNHMEIPHEFDKALSAGSHSFGVTLNNLYVNGDNIKGVYSINNVAPADFGYKLNLMNARDPTIQGHLKIILNKNRHVEALVFKRSNKEKEIIFFLPELTESQDKKELDYFTDRFELELEHIDSIWGKAIRPFLLHHTGKNVQQRLTYGDSTIVSFEEIYRVVDKTKKKKKKKPKKKEATSENSDIEVGGAEGEEENVEAVTDTTEEEGTAEEVETEEEKEYRIYEENMAKVAVILKLSSLLEIEAAIAELDEEFQKKIKVVKEYFIVIKSIAKYDDGTFENKVRKIKLKKWSEREDELAEKVEEERFQIDFTTEKGEHIYMYLSGDRTISSFEYLDAIYMMRGH